MPVTPAPPRSWWRSASRRHKSTRRLHYTVPVKDSPRIQDLRRRVEQDPASLAFAPLAEELRRAGRLDDAIEVCRAGLRYHPEYVSARATLGRALLDANLVDEAFLELSQVLSTAPDHLAALRGMADILQRRGQYDEAQRTLQQALTFAPDDPELKQAAAPLATHAPARPPAAPPARELEVLARLEALLDAVLADRARRAASYQA